jgi:alkylation response protein AidB-like acyl-CoA dehydrogenase
MMFEWSDTDLIVRDTVRRFIDKEIRPHLDGLEAGETRTLWGQNIGQFQLIQLKLANMEVARMNVRNILFPVIESAQKGKPISLPEASAIKWYCSQAATDVAMDAVQLFGGNGYMTEYRVEQLARDAKSLMIYAGSNEVQITHVAKGLLSGA